MGRKTAEGRLLDEIMLKAGEMGFSLFRNQVGVYKVNGRVIRSGLCVGSSDLIGWSPEGKFVAIEVKIYPRKPTQAQESFISAALKSGCIAGVCYSVEDFINLVS